MRPGWLLSHSETTDFATVNADLAVYRGQSKRRILLDMNSTLWTIDPIHSTIGFGVRHLLITNVHGVFERVSGTVRYDSAAPESTEIRVEIPADSVDTRAPQRDAHLRSADFFDAEHHPLITFQSTRVRSTGESSLEVTGDLTLRGVTRQIVLSVVDLAHVPADFNGQPRLGASASGKLKRSEFGMTFNKVLDAGGLAISDEVTLRFDVSLQKADVSAAA